MEKREQDIMKELKRLKKDELCKILTDYIIDGYEYLEENGYDEYEDDKKPKPLNEFKLLTPMEIKAKLDQTVIGQDDTKIKLATEVFRHYLRIENEKKLHKENKSISKNNILLTGLTGTGKTFLMQQIAKMLNIPIYIEDSTTLTSAGYVGNDIEHCLKGLLENADWDVSRAEKGIIVLDEFDKLSRKGENVSITRDVSGESVQQGLLKILEGNLVGVPQGQRKHPREECIEIDTSNILFIASGSFEGIEEIVKQRINKKNNKGSIGFGADIKSKNEETPLKDIRLAINRDDLKKYGILPEILGRFSILSNLHPLEKEDLINILRNQNGLFNEYETIFNLMNKELIIKDEVYEFIAGKSLFEKVGARGLSAIVEDLMYKTIYEMPSEDKKRYIIDKEFCESINSNIA